MAGWKSRLPFSFGVRAGGADPEHPRTRRLLPAAISIGASMSAKKGTIAILTGGGDVPGLNPAIRAVTIRGAARGLPGHRHPPRLGRARRARSRDDQDATTPTASSSSPRRS
ncbi:MAG: hypothetical protein MZV70_08110 [Desulfobacterales bacterium]|nr:hypothetical protein [Desulfobacterales bacterium]